MPRIQAHAAAILAVAALIWLGMAASASAASRHAFVVGNGSYVAAPHLPNPTNDARDVALQLERQGYRVMLGIDLGRAEFLERFQRFIRGVPTDGIALLYYAGHGLQIGGENYLFPVDATIDSEGDARRRLVPLNALIADLSRASRTRIVILDACRNNPFEEKLAQAEATRSAGLARGLARVYAGVGSFIAYSTQPGNVALDGSGRNSPFTEALLRHMGEPGADVHAVMRRVRGDVQRATGERQIPWENSSLIDEVAFATVGLPPAAAPPPVSEPADPSKQTARERFQTSITAQSYAYVTGLDPQGDNFLALRTGPSTGHERIATMGPDTLLQVLETRGVWRRVSLLDGTTGWAHGNWIKCCRRIAPQPAASPPQGGEETCDSLWLRRNAIWHRHGYCFASARGRQVFGNEGCTRDLAGARAAMSPGDRALVEALDARERELGCR